MASVSFTKVLSRPTGCVLKPVPSIIPIQDGGSSLLSYKKKELVWVFVFSFVCNLET